MDGPHRAVSLARYTPYYLLTNLIRSIYIESLVIAKTEESTMDPIAALRNIRLRSSGISNKVRCVPGWRWSPSIPLPDYDLWYVCEGSGEIRLSGTMYALKPGTCMLVRPQSLPLATQDEKRRPSSRMHLDLRPVHLRKPAAPSARCGPGSKAMEGGRIRLPDEADPDLSPSSGA